MIKLEAMPKTGDGQVYALTDSLGQTHRMLVSGHCMTQEAFAAEELRLLARYFDKFSDQIEAGEVEPTPLKTDRVQT